MILNLILLMHVCTLLVHVQIAAIFFFFILTNNSILELVSNIKKKSIKSTIVRKSIMFVYHVITDINSWGKF